MKVVVFGEDIYTSTVIESLIESGHKVLLIVTPEYYNENYIILKETALKYHIGFIKTKNVNSAEVESYLEKVKPELIVAVHLRKILHKEIFSQAARGAINVHPSLLPRYRGLSPQHQVILHGDDESGVTVHFIDADFHIASSVLQVQTQTGYKCFACPRIVLTPFAFRQWCAEPSLPRPHIH